MRYYRQNEELKVRDALAARVRELAAQIGAGEDVDGRLRDEMYLARSDLQCLRQHAMVHHPPTVRELFFRGFFAAAADDGPPSPSPPSFCCRFLPPSPRACEQRRGTHTRSSVCCGRWWEVPIS